MICTTIQHHSLEEIADILENTRPRIQMAEIRLDRCPLDAEEIGCLFSMSDTPLVATCRVHGDGSGTWEEAEKKLDTAIKAGAVYVDLEIEAPKEMGKRLRRTCSEYGTVMIRSSHFFAGTPSDEVLRDTVDKCERFGGEIVKVAAMAGSEEDARRVLSLYSYIARTAEEETAPCRLVAFAMGEKGRDSRLECLKLGSPFTYAALSEEEAAAPGQWFYASMLPKIYGEKKFLHCDGSLNMPASKSFAQRAVIAAALADGESRLGGYSPCGDNEAAIEVAKALGAEVTVEGTEVIVKGIGGEKNIPGKINVGESGLLTRLVIPVVAALGHGARIEIDGRGTLPGRPLKGASEIMANFGTVLRPLVAAPEVHVPLTVQGPLLPGKASVSGKGGSQLISGLLMALPLLEEDSILHVEDPKSIPYMFITLDVLRRFGIKIGSEMEGDEEFMETQDWSFCTGVTFKIKGRQTYTPASFDIEGDWSAAANFLVAGALFGDVRLTGLDTSSLQADISIMDILMEAGASLSQLEDPAEENGEEAGQTGHKGLITAQKAPLRAFDTDLNNCPDLFPITAVLASFCQGCSNIEGFKRLAGKESDRGTAILNMLAQMGVPAFADGDTLTIDGESVESRLLNGHLLKGGDYTSSHDHRMAMALTVASWCADSPVNIDDTGCIAKSYPDFLNVYRKLL